MKLGRALLNEKVYDVVIDGDYAKVVDGIFVEQIQFTGEIFPLSEATLLAPSSPKIVLGMAHNGSKEDLKNPPQAFQKSPRTVIGPGDSILHDSFLGVMHVECELATVIKKKARKLTLDNALDHVLGFTIGNDVTLPEQNSQDSLLMQSKNGDGFTPLGPWIETDITNFDNLSLFVNVNGTRVISSSTAQLARGVIEQLVYITHFMTLDSGDVILGGSPKTMYPVVAGDVVDLEIEGIGTLRNHISSAI